MKYAKSIKGLVFPVAVGVLLMAASTPLFAHHGSSAYDLEHSLTLEATVTGFDWSNPHCLLHFDADDDKGVVQHWAIEMYNPLWMSRAGWSKDTLKSGDHITITFHPAKNGTPNGYIRDGDGKIVFNGQELSFHGG